MRSDSSAGLDPFRRRGLESRRSNPSGWWRLVRARSFLAALFMLGATNVVEAADTPADVVQRALGEAKRVAPDLRLVQLQFLGFAFATGKNGIPDMTREGPPRGAVFYFLAPSTALRVFIRMNRDAQYPAIDSEYEMVRTNVPKNSWTWWTRVKHAAYWQYFMVDPATGQGMTRCTAPNDGSSAIAMRSCP